MMMMMMIIIIIIIIGGIAGTLQWGRGGGCRGCSTWRIQEVQRGRKRCPWHLDRTHHECEARNMFNYAGHRARLVIDTGRSNVLDALSCYLRLV